jgi:hypothetical protein
MQLEEVDEKAQHKFIRQKKKKKANERLEKWESSD